MLILIFRVCFFNAFFCVGFLWKIRFSVIFTLKFEPNHAFDAYFFMMSGCDFLSMLIRRGGLSRCLFFFLSRVLLLMFISRGVFSMLINPGREYLFVQGW